MDSIIFALSNVLENLELYIEAFLTNLGLIGALCACLLIVVESIIPVLPICVFITLVFLAFGNFIGFLISWIFTTIGCVISFWLFRGKIKNWIEQKFMKKDNKAKKFMKYIDNMSLASLSTLVAIPFTPASVVNIAAGLSNMSFKKFLYAILIGKVFMVYFWGYIGTTLIESITNPVYLVKILLMLVSAFVISKIINRYFNVE